MANTRNSVSGAPPNEGEEETVDVELPRSTVAEVAPEKLLPEGYRERGLAGGRPTELAGKRVQSFSVTKLGVDTFVAGAPEGCPHDSRQEVIDNTETTSDEQRRYLYGTDSPRAYGEIYFATVPDECPFCASAIDRVVGSHIEHGGVPNVGVLACPECDRILAKY